VQLAHEIFNLDPEVRVPVRDTIVYLFSDEYLQYISEAAVEAKILEDRCIATEGTEGHEDAVRGLADHLRETKQRGIDMLELFYALTPSGNPLNGEGKDE
jgi:hypothetical protein